jgi:type I restriction enzyme M protein
MSNPQVSQQEIESWLWESANILRGPVDPANLRDFVFPLLFLKRLSDSWDEEQEKAVDDEAKAAEKEFSDWKKTVKSNTEE